MRPAARTSRDISTLNARCNVCTSASGTRRLIVFERGGSSGGQRARQQFGVRRL